MTSLEKEGFDIESRLRSIATNAIQEARIANSRGAEPFTDDDALRLETVFQLLHVQKKLEKEYEHFPLVASEQAPSSATLLKISDLLGNLDDDEFKEPESVTVSVNLPKAANAKK